MVNAAKMTAAMMMMIPLNGNALGQSHNSVEKVMWKPGQITLFSSMPENTNTNFHLYARLTTPWIKIAYLDIHWAINCGDSEY